MDTLNANEIDQSLALDSISDLARSLVDLVTASRSDMAGTPPLAEIDLLARLIGLTADQTDPHATANLYNLWGISKLGATLLQERLGGLTTNQPLAP